MLIKTNPLFVLTCFSLRLVLSADSSSTGCSQTPKADECSDTFTNLFLFQSGFRLAKKQHPPEEHIEGSTNASTGTMMKVWQRHRHFEFAPQVQIWQESPVLHRILLPRTRRYVRKGLETVGYYTDRLTQTADGLEDSAAIEVWHTLAKIVAAFFAAFTMCTDDLLWFMPFAISPRKYTFCIWYIIFIQFAVIVSWALTGTVALADQRWPNNPLQSILELLSIAFLAYYTISLAVEWYYEDQDSPNGETQEGTGMNDGIANIPDASGQKSESPTRTSQTRTVRELAFISILGNLDNMTLYIALLFAGTFGALELMLGAFIASLLVCGICVGLGFLQIIREIFTYIPLWAILGVITTWAAARLAVEAGSSEGATTI